MKRYSIRSKFLQTNRGLNIVPLLVDVWCQRLIDVLIIGWYQLIINFIYQIYRRRYEKMGNEGIRMVGGISRTLKFTIRWSCYVIIQETDEQMIYKDHCTAAYVKISYNKTKITAFKETQ